ncbi:MAG UNVERIFIED_CONTAM: HlyD family secretion protein [Rickettsiaceae bacterium]
MFNQTLQELERAQQNLGEIKQKLAQAKDAYEKSVMVSPVDGIVNVLRPTTIGGLVGNELVAEISPDKDFLVVEARVAPKDIGYVTNGMKAKLRFGAFKSRTTPTFTGKVVSISPDVVVDKSADPRAENAYYQARIEMDMEEFEKDAKRLNLVLLPGMQVDVQIITGTRTLLRYLLDPITDNMFKGLKEK